MSIIAITCAHNHNKKNTRSPKHMCLFSMSTFGLVHQIINDPRVINRTFLVFIKSCVAYFFSSVLYLCHIRTICRNDVHNHDVSVPKSTWLPWFSTQNLKTRRTRENVNDFKCVVRSQMFRIFPLSQNFYWNLLNPTINLRNCFRSYDEFTHFFSMRVMTEFTVSTEPVSVSREHDVTYHNAGQFVTRSHLVNNGAINKENRTQRIAFNTKSAPEQNKKKKQFSTFYE